MSDIPRVGGLDLHEVLLARRAALKTSQKVGGHVTVATGRISAPNGTIQSNTGHACTSRHVILVQIIGDMNTGAAASTASVTTRDSEIDLIVDSVTGDTCSISLRPGHDTPSPRSDTLFKDRTFR